MEVGLLIACASLMPCAGDYGSSNAVDIFNVTSGAWSTAALSVARSSLAATSLPSQGLAIFAGGYDGVLFCLVDVGCGIVVCVCGVGSGGMRRALSGHLHAAAC